LSRFGRHFVRIREIKAFERRLIALLVDRPGVLHERHEALFRYAVTLSQMHLFRTPDGTDVSLAEDVNPLRGWLLESIVPLIPDGGPPNIETLREIAPVLALRLDQTRDQILERHSDEFTAEHLDDEIRYKGVALVLGGGGGSGLLHLGTFALLEEELGVSPDLIVGSSMGSVMGLLRALDRDYDPVQTALSLPRDMDYNAIFRPFTGYSRYGFPGAFHLNLLRSARTLFQQLFGEGMPRFSDLPIRLEIVATGIRTGFQIDEARYQRAAKETEGLGPIAVRKRLRLFFSAVRDLSRNPRFLSQVVFGREPGTERFPVVEAVGFSCAVPGLLHYDIFHDDPETIDPLDAMFERHRLLRLCDGGVVNNVPSRVAWESIQSGSVGKRNVHIMAFDVFAPVTRGRNMIFIPIQQIARPGVQANRPYSDFHKTFKRSPSPLQIIVNSYSKLKKIVEDGRAQLQPDVAYMKKAIEPLPEYGIWEKRRSE
jgi:predicted acylesterase/phospholipase RssA